MILEVVAVTTIHHKMSVKVHLWEISWDEAVYFPHCNRLFVCSDYFHPNNSSRHPAAPRLPGGWYLSSAVSPLSGWKTDRCNICPPAVARSVCCMRFITALMRRSSLREYYGQWKLMFLIFTWHFTQSQETPGADLLQPGAETCCWKSNFFSVRRNFFKNTWSFHTFLNAVNRICGPIKC